MSLEPIYPMVFHVVLALDPGGLERVVLDLVKARNCMFPGRTKVICLDHAGPWAGELAPEEIVVIKADRRRKPWDRAAIRKISETVRQAELISEQPVLLHSHNMAAQQYAALTRRSFSKVAHIQTRHGRNPHNISWFNRWRNRWMMKYTDRFVAVSAATGEAVSRQGIPSESIRVIANGIPLAFHADTALIDSLKSTHAITSDSFVIGSIGRLDPIKGYDRLIRSMSHLELNRDFRLVLIGDGPEKTRLEHLVTQRGLEAKVHFLGYRNNGRELLELMSLFVLSSRSEGMPIALLEAMAAGIPVAVTDVGSCAEVIGRGERGTVLPDDDSAWPALFNHLSRDSGREEAQEKARQARQFVHSQWSIEQSANAYEALYRDVILQHNTGAGRT